MPGYTGEHPIVYLAATGFVGGHGVLDRGVRPTSNRPDARVELWALYGAIVGMYVGLMLILFDPVLH